MKGEDLIREVERLRAMLPPANQEYAAVDYTIQEAIEALSATPAMPSESEIRLACGEMSAQEMRTVKAVLAWFIRATEKTKRA